MPIKIGLSLETNMRGAGVVTLSLDKEGSFSKQVIQVEQGIYYTLINKPQTRGCSYIFKSDAVGTRISYYSAHIYKGDYNRLIFDICDFRQSDVRLVSYLFTSVKTVIKVLRNFSEVKGEPGNITVENRDYIVHMLEGIAQRELGMSDIRVYDIENSGTHTLSTYAIRKALLAAFHAGAKLGR